VGEDYNPLNPVDYVTWMGEAWYATLTEGPSAGFDVIAENYVEHVSTGAMFIPGAGSIGKAYKIRGGVGGAVSLSRTLSKPGGRVGLALQQTTKHKQTGIRIMSAGKVMSRVTTIEAGKLALDGHYVKAGMVWFGPPGSLLAYETYKGKPGSDLVEPTSVTIQPKVVEPKTKPVRSKKKKPSKMSSAQKKRLWRMGLRWCSKHGRYDKCSLRAR
jgi:hypothetical protein